MSNKINFNLHEYTIEYFNSIRELIVPDFSLTIILVPISFDQVKSTILGKFHTNAFANFSKNLKEHLYETGISRGSIRLVFGSSVSNFDISFIGVIALFKNSFPNFRFEIVIPEDIEDEVFYKFRDILFSIKNWYKESEGINLFEVVYSGLLNIRYNEPRGILPIVLLTRDSFINYFSTKSNVFDFTTIFKNIDSKDLNKILRTRFEKYDAQAETDIKSKRKYSVAEENYRIIRDTIKYFDKKLNWQGNQRVFFHHYILMLSNFDLLIESLVSLKDIHLDEIPFKSFRKVNLNAEEMQVLHSAVKNICFKLSEEPIFLTLIFSILANRNIDKRINNVTEFILRLNDLFEYSNNLFLGIKEIARNIIDHTQTKVGIICGKESSGNNLYEINNDLFQDISDLRLNGYFDELKHAKLLQKELKKEPFFQITIFDEGQQGIISKTIENIESLTTLVEDKEHLFLKDLRNLRNGVTKFYHFFDTREFKLYHQSYKASSHWGIVSLTNLINRNFGLISASTFNNFDKSIIDKCITHFSKTQEIEHSRNDFLFGTKFEIILPVGKTIPLSKKRLINIAPKSQSFSVKNYLKLFEYQYIDKEEQIISKSINYLFAVEIKKYVEYPFNEEYRNEYSIAKNIGKLLKDTYEKNKNIIPVLDFANTSEIIDHSKLLRFLGSLQLELEIDSLILINVESKIVLGLNTILNLKFPGTDNFQNWNQNHFTLIYSFAEDPDGNRMYYTDILGGATIREFKLLKNKLSSTHSTIIDYKYSVGEALFSKETIKSFEKSQLFVEDTGIVKNFEMLLTFKNKSFFEHSLKYILNAKIDVAQYGYSGYKIEESHFKLGSKTHIRDFIYAKRIFQNSFFTDRFAFMITNYYLLKYPKNKSLTIIGYGDYSQMLINRVEKMLMASLSNAKINHDMISDVEKPIFIKNEELNENILIIVPVNTTFSTTIKIEDLVSRRILANASPGSSTLLTPSLNLILVSHKDIEDKEYVSLLNEYLASSNNDRNSEFPHKSFYWKKVNINEKLVELGTNPSKAEITKKEQYFITIKSEWYLPEKCESCFPPWNSDNPAQKFGIYSEKPLLETDKTSVTPDLLLDLPASDSINVNYKETDIFITEESLIGNHLEYKGTHHQYFINPIPFFITYRERIEKWAALWRDKLKFNMPELFNSSILLIAPSERNNTYFIELINRIIFNDSAVIIHYEVSGDYTENYQKFFSANINQSDYIFYIDDFIQTGKTFHLVNNFIRYCSNLDGYEIKERIKNKTCDGVFTMISKTDKYASNDIVSQIYPNKKIEEELRFNTFYYLNINNIILDKCPLCSEKKKYTFLSENSILDSVKYFFLNEAVKFELKDFTSIHSSDNGWLRYHPLVSERSILPWSNGSTQTTILLFKHYIDFGLPNKAYIKLLIQNLLNNILSSNKEIRDHLEFPFQNLKFDDKLKHVEKIFQTIIIEIKNSNPFNIWYNNYDPCILSILDNVIEDTLIKILTAIPFSNIRYIKEKTFFWLTVKVDRSIDEFILRKKLNFKKFREIKFLLKRLTGLGSNYIIRKNALLKFREIYQIYTSESRDRIESQRKEQTTLLNKEFEELIINETNLQTELKKHTDQLSSNDMFRESERKDKISIILDSLKEIDNKRKYIIQAVRNIQYIEVTLQEFSYYFVSVVKETTYASDFKILKLEQNIDQIIHGLNKHEDAEFLFLLLLLKYENVFLVKNAMEIITTYFIKQDRLIYFDNKFSQHNVRYFLDEKFTLALEDYRLNAFKQYLGINDILTWKKKNEQKYLHLIELLYLYSCLKNENDDEFVKPSNFKLENKTKTILQNFFRIAIDNNSAQHKINHRKEIEYSDNKKNGAFIVLKNIDNGSNAIEPGNLLVAYATKPYNNLNQDYEILNAPFDYESLSFLMLNGLSSRHDVTVEKVPAINKWVGEQIKSPNSLNISHEYPKKPWTIWEILKQTDDKKNESWYSPWGSIYSINNHGYETKGNLQYDNIQTLNIPNDFTENLYLSENILSFAFIRLSDISIKSRKIRSNGLALIVLFSDSLSLDVDRLKLSLILLPEITSFIKKHYDSDSLKAFIEERNEKIEVEKLQHGFQRYLDKLKELAESPGDKVDRAFIDVIYNSIIPWARLKQLAQDYKNAQLSETQLKEQRPLGVICTLKEAFDRIERTFNIIVKNEIGRFGEAEKESFIDCLPAYDIDKNTKIELSLKLFDVIMTEACINAKNNKIGQYSYYYNLYCRFFLDSNDLVMLEFTNYCDINDNRFIKRLNKQNRNNKHGLGLINYISVELFNKPIAVKSIKKSDNFEMFEFSLCLPLAKLHHEEEHILP